MKAIWEEIKNHLKNDLPENIFSLWINPIQSLDEKNDSVKFKDLHPDIAKSLSKSTNPEIEKLNITHGNPQ
mgnify:CR=1 FL=1